jgi:peptidoglycan/xylan/chitin deacetylase (PgdA/CDA1 family)
MPPKERGESGTFLLVLRISSAAVRWASVGSQVRWPRRRLWASVRSRTINLTFHGVGRTERPLEPDEELVWLDQEQFESVLDSVVGRSDVQITFDDGNASDVEHALPQLRRRELTATFFVVAGRLGAPGFLDERGVRALAAAGMGIGCHGMRHRPWRRLDERALWEEVVEARRLLEQVVERPVTEAACPFGSYDRRVLRFLRGHGYRRAYTSDRGTARPGDWIQARNTVRPGNAAGVVEHVLAEGSTHNVLRRRAKLMAKRWR